MNLSRLIIAPTLLLTATSASAHGTDDYPTNEVVAYVIDCMQKQQGGMTYENLYKCSCSIDYIASQMSHDEFVIADTYTRGENATGERSEILREGEFAEESRDDFETVEAQAARHCFLPAQAAEAESEED
jgi:hypothetical protein